MRLLCGCTVLCACWWLGGANEGGPIKWRCDKTRQKEQSTTAQNPFLTSHLNITLYLRPPSAPFPSPTHSPIQHNTTQHKTKQDNNPPYVVCTLPVRLLCGCTVRCACWWLGGANGGGSIKWCCDKTRQKEQGTTAQNPIFTSPLNIKLYPSPPPTPFHSPTHSPASQSPHPMQDKETNETKFEFKNSEHELSTTHYLIQILSLQPEIEFRHLFYFYPIPSRVFFCIGKKSAFSRLKTGKCLDASLYLDRASPCPLSQGGGTSCILAGMSPFLIRSLSAFLSHSSLVSRYSLGRSCCLIFLIFHCQSANNFLSAGTNLES